MSADPDLPHSRRVIDLGDGCIVTIEPCVGYVETRPVTGFIRTQLREAPTRVNMARALMGHALAVLDELDPLLSPAEFSAVHAASVPLVDRLIALTERVDWQGPGGVVVREPEG